MTDFAIECVRDLVDALELRHRFVLLSAKTNLLADVIDRLKQCIILNLPLKDDHGQVCLPEHLELFIDVLAHTVKYPLFVT